MISNEQDRHSQARQRASKIRKGCLTHFVELGIGNALDPMRELLDRADQLSQETADASASADTIMADVVDRLASGDELGSVAADVRKRQKEIDTATLLNTASAAAEYEARQRAEQWISTNADTLISEHLHPLAAAAAAECSAVVKSLPEDVNDADAAIAAGPAAAALWADGVKACATWRLAHKARASLPRAKSRQPAPPLLLLEVADPVRIDAATLIAPWPLRRLAAAHDSGAQPGVYSPAQADALMTELKTLANAANRERHVVKVNNDLGRGAKQTLPPWPLGLLDNPDTPFYADWENGLAALTQHNRKVPTRVSHETKNETREQWLTRVAHANNMMEYMK